MYWASCTGLTPGRAQTPQTDGGGDRGSAPVLRSETAEFGEPSPKIQERRARFKWNSHPNHLPFRQIRSVVATDPNPNHHTLDMGEVVETAPAPGRAT